MAARPAKTAEPGASHPGQLINCAGHRTRGRGTRESWSTSSASDPKRVARESWLILRALRTLAESPGRTGRHRGPGDPSESRLVEVVEHAYPQSRARVVRDIWSTPREHASGPESPGTAVRHLKHWNLVSGHPEDLVESTGLQTLAGAALESGLAPRAIGAERESPVQLVDPAGPRTRARVARESWSTPQALGNGPESPWTVVRTCRPSDQGTSRRDSWSTPQELGLGPESPGRAG